MPSAKEIFLTGTAAEVTPVGEIDGYAYTVGNVTQTLVEDYEREVGKTPVDANTAAE